MNIQIKYNSEYNTFTFYAYGMFLTVRNEDLEELVEACRVAINESDGEEYDKFLDS